MGSNIISLNEALGSFLVLKQMIGRLGCPSSHSCSWAAARGMNLGGAVAEGGGALGGDGAKAEGVGSCS